MDFIKKWKVIMHIITDEYRYTLIEMLMSKDQDTVNLANDIISNRDKTDSITEINFNIISRKLFAHKNMRFHMQSNHPNEGWIVKINGKRVKFRSNKSIWESKRNASLAWSNAMVKPNVSDLQNMGFKTIKEYKEYLIEQKIVEFIKLT